MAEDSKIVSIGAAQLQKIVQFRVKEGSDLLLGIKEAVQREGIASGVIISGIGALNKAIFRNLKVFPEQFPVRREDRIYLDIDSPMELVSLGGWIASSGDGEVEIHAHFSASTVKGDSVSTLGGHLTEGTIAGIKVVVAIAVLEGDIEAQFDKRTKGKDIVFG